MSNKERRQKCIEFLQEDDLAAREAVLLSLAIHAELELKAIKEYHNDALNMNLT